MTQLLKFIARIVPTVLLLAGCNHAPSPTPADPRVIVEEAGDVVSQARSFRVIIERAGAPVYVDTADTTGAIEFLRAAGQFVAPDRIQVTVKIRMAGLVSEGEFLALSAAQFLSHSVLTGGRWLRYDFVPGLDPAAILAAEGGLQHALSSMRGLELVGVEDVDGAQSYHLRGVGNGADVAALTLGLIGGGDVEVDAWVSTDELYVSRILVVEPNRPLPEGETEPPVWTIELYDYDEPAIIEAPADFAEISPTATPPGFIQPSLPQP